MMKYLLVFLVPCCVLAGCVGATPNVPVKLKNIAEQRQLPRCLPAPEMNRVLFKQFKETLKASAILSASKKLLVLFYSSNTGTFTITITGQDQISCAILWGSDYSTGKKRNSIKI